jgi:UPF0755 protein
MKNRGRAVFFLIALSLVAIFVAAEIHHELRTPRWGWAEPGVFEVERGETFDDVLSRLEGEGILRRSQMLRWWARIRGWDRRIRAGHYEIGPATPPIDVLRTLVDGPRVLQRVTLPEGLRLEESLRILGDSLDIPLDELHRASRDTAWLRSLDLPVPDLEGYVFPETYHFDPGTPVRAVLEHITAMSRAIASEERLRRARDLGLTWHEVVTLASIIEAEARLPEERPRISAVFHNRLARGLPLQADPTVQYAVGKKAGNPPLSKDLEFESPYNTYITSGLPPGPINSPGVACLAAALHPLPGSRELYFVAHPDGSHVFSRTLGEHERARGRMRALWREASR